MISVHRQKNGLTSLDGLICGPLRGVTRFTCPHEGRFGGQRIVRSRVRSPGSCARLEMHFATEFWLSRLCFQRALAGISLSAFLVAVIRFIPLLGARGLQPVRICVNRVPFRRAPSLFYIKCSDRFITATIWCGVGLSCFALTGFSESFGLGVSMLTWALLWIIYISLVNVGQTFYGFGW